MSTLRPWAHLVHVACVLDDRTIVEAVFPRVRKVAITTYRPQDVLMWRTGLADDPQDARQAVRYLLGCVGEDYGTLTCAGILLRYLTPTREGLFLGRNRTGICSGMAGTMLERGWPVFPVVAATLGPAELAREIGVPAHAR